MSLILGIGIGMEITRQRNILLSTKDKNNYIRLSGYKYISPLLLCDDSPKHNAAALDTTRKNIESYLDSLQLSNDSQITVYQRYLNSGDEYRINPGIKYYPASIKKLPLLISVLKASETNSQLLSTTGKFVINADINDSEEVFAPAQKLVSGNNYSIQDLLDMMIKYSDNNSFAVLYQFITPQKADQIYSDMKLYFPDTFSSTDDYITSYQVSLFYRLLYNATYLSSENSEKALQLLAETDYNRGLRSGIAESIPVAHKYGISANKSTDGNLYGELHDCGIIYKPDNPYILCVMTKSTSKPISFWEQTIAKIASLSFNE